MRKIETGLSGVYILEPEIHGDHRGWFIETYSRGTFEALGLDYTFVQDNESFTERKNTLRGLHFQNNPMAQAKFVRAERGSVRDVAVDIRKGSPTYLKWVAVELSQENRRMLLIPRGFAHGFLTLTDDVIFAYKVDQLYAPEYDRGIRYDDPSIGVDWGTQNPVLSAKDQNVPLLSDSDCNFTYEGEMA